MGEKQRRRVKVSATVDAETLDAVDALVGSRPGLDRSKVIDEALHLWYAREQERAMETQYSDDAEVDSDELTAWQTLRRAAAQRRFGQGGDR